MLRAAAGVTVRVSGASPVPVLLHAAADDGSVLMLLDAGAELVRRCGADPGMVALVEAVDVCPVPVPDRVRARVWLGGALRLAATSSISTDPAGLAASRLLEGLPDGAAHPWAQLAVLHLAPTAIALGRGDEARTCAERVRWENYVAADPDPLVMWRPAGSAT